MMIKYLYKTSALHSRRENVWPKILFLRCCSPGSRSWFHPQENFAHFWPFPDAGTVANSLYVTSAPCEPEILAHLSHLARPGSTGRKLNSPPTVRQFATVCIIYGAPITLRHYIMDYFAN